MAGMAEIQAAIVMDRRKACTHQWRVIPTKWVNWEKIECIHCHWKKTRRVIRK